MILVNRNAILFLKKKESKIRKGRDIEESSRLIILDIKTRCPSKWILVDTETGQTYKGNPDGYWDRLDPVESKKNNEN